MYVYECLFVCVCVCVCVLARVCVCDDIELLRYYMNSIFGCAVMCEIKQ